MFIVVQVAKQTIESDYTPLDTQLLRAQTDEGGNVVVSVPYAMRNIETPNAETLVYTFAYYDDEIILNGQTFPAGSLNGEQKRYIHAHNQKPCDHTWLFYCKTETFLQWVQ